MPQKQVKRRAIGNSKKQAANKHGKAAETTRKGRVLKQPIKGRILETFKDNKEISKMINKKNEANASAAANNKGGLLKMLKGPPPVTAPKDSLTRKSRKAKEEEEEIEEEEVEVEVDAMVEESEGEEDA